MLHFSSHLEKKSARAVFGAALLACTLTVSFYSSFSAHAQDAVPIPPSREELDAKRQALEKTKENETRIRQEIEQIATERKQLSEDLIATAKRIDETEKRIITSEERLSQLIDNERNIQRALDGRKDILAELLAALQRLGRNPPPALLVRPEDALKSVRSAILLGAILPEIRDEAAELVNDLEEMLRIQQASRLERANLENERTDLATAQQRINLLIEARQKRTTERQQALADERKKMEELARQVQSFEELITRSEQELASAKAAAEAAAKAQAELDKQKEAEKNTLADSARTSPAIAFSKARGLLPLPVSANPLNNFGENDGFGGEHKGLSLSTRPRAQVTSPVDGWVVYAGRFRSYGQLLILNAGDGYHIVLAGMDTIHVELGQFVVMGEPVAQMGASGTRNAAAVSTGSKQPVLYVEFRKDGQAIDPTPWWAVQLTKKASG